MSRTERAAIVERVSGWLATAPRVLIGAGAGLSVAAGIDYTDTESFARLYPGMKRRGFRACYELIGRHNLPPAAFWGYWALHVHETRFSARTAPVYQALRALTADKDVFVLTSNVDAFFTRHGFDADRVWTPQGDFAHMHCTARRRSACADLVWASQPIVENLLKHLHPSTQEVSDASALPRCPACGGAVFFNVREDATFVETPYAEQARRCLEWVRSAADDPLLIVEIGAGFNTPGVVRWPLERLAVRHPVARLVRINREHAAVPPELGDRGIGIAGDAGDVLRVLWGSESALQAGPGTAHPDRQPPASSR
jgi:NAD-dependent SIR2 family protein deacetylase